MAEFRGGHIEALVASANGVVTSEARAAIEDALRLDPTNVRARFFGGLAKEQAGDKAAALADWTALRNDASPSEPWLADLDTRISDLEGGLRAARGDLPAAAKPVIAGVMPAISKSQRISPAPEAGPRQQDVQAAQAMSPADRSAMVRGMVDGLAIRLERSPRDAEGWIKLIRSHIVLGESELARQALEHSLTVFADSPPERERIAAAARQLGVSR